MSENTCFEDECRVWYPPFPDTEGWRYCKQHYPAPNDGEFTHVPDEERRNELLEMYDE
ncbi:hypothetical protein ACOZ32_09310 [Halobacterium sp. MBLA0001]|uniref:hypothetical protein n=1 Tax=Halobacterium TaxID=2239 RepID=UPI0025528A0A|nr:hypothetical protein [Halobacterium salinarum]MDL0128153.1 hypothetical protein [Halobacterium salinarum]